jgi:nucleoside-diphosphate-sugar epimerase
MSILITGGAGFIGSHLIRHLLETERERLVVLDTDLDVQGLIRSSDDRVMPVLGDVLDRPKLLRTIERWRVERIVHLAYILETRDDDVRWQIEVNVMGTTNVFEAARLSGVSRVVYASSAYVYPHRHTLGGPQLSEDDPPAPDAVYGACKLFNEHIAQQYADLLGLDPVGLRFTAAFGPGRARRERLPSGDLMTLPEVAVREGSVVMPPNGQLCDLMHVTDAVEAMLLSCRAERLEHRVFNVASECRPVGDLTAVLRDLLPDADIRVGEAPFVLTSLMRTDRLRSALGFRPRYTLEEGMKHYLDTVRGCRV